MRAWFERGRLPNYLAPIGTAEVEPEAFVPHTAACRAPGGPDPLMCPDAHLARSGLGYFLLVFVLLFFFGSPQRGSGRWNALHPASVTLLRLRRLLDRPKRVHPSWPVDLVPWDGSGPGAHHRRACATPSAATQTYVYA